MKVNKANRNTNDLAITMSNKQLLNILHSLPDLALIIDRDFRIVFCNWKENYKDVPPAQRRKNMRCYEVYCRSEICNPCHIQKVFDTGIPIITKKTCPTAGNIQINAFPIFDEDGTIVMAGEYHHDANGLQQAKDTTHNSLQVFEAIVEDAPLATIALDNELKVTHWNPAAESMLGWKREEVIGKLYPLLTTDIRDEVFENIHQIKTGNLRRFLETQRMHKNGTLIDVSLSTACLKNNAGVAIGYVAIMADITEHKQALRALRQSEASYRTIFDAANDAHFVFDAEDATILDVNLKMCEMYGFDNREEALRHNVEEMMAGYPPYTLNDLLPLIWKAKDGRSQTFEWLAKHTSGRLFWMEVVMKGVIISGEYKVLAVVRDTMDRKAAEEENKRMRETLLHADKMAAIGTMASGIAHEINNPNNFILSNAQFLSDIWPNISRILTHYAEENGEIFLGKMRYSEASDIIPEMINGITEGAYRIKGIVTGLKDFSRQEKASLDQKVDMNKVIEAALSMLQNKIKKHTDYFDCWLDQEIPLVKGNFQQLEQVIVNLALNALEALSSRAYGVQISTSYSKHLKMVLVKVKDQGGGMSDDIQKSIFDPFFTTKLESGGTGLGLSICFSILKKHNGTIECDSKPGEGTAFLLRIPALESK
ncbi:MAG: PAS domain S-box protein [Geobacteraceae bacterium]|nr:PAS domain S-box protein [Geobacteraceae bacterium]